MPATNESFALASNIEEVALRRKLLFRLLRDYDFSRPVRQRDYISDPIAPDRVRGNRTPGR